MKCIDDDGDSDNNDCGDNDDWLQIPMLQLAGLALLLANHKTSALLICTSIHTS